MAKKFRVSQVKVKTFVNPDKSEVKSNLVYLNMVSDNGFGKSETIFTNFIGDELPEAGSSWELDETRIQPVVGSDGKTRKWFI
jgi:hypothetical protein